MKTGHADLAAGWHAPSGDATKAAEWRRLDGFREPHISATEAQASPTASGWRVIRPEPCNWSRLNPGLKNRNLGTSKTNVSKDRFG